MTRAVKSSEEAAVLLSDTYSGIKYAVLRVRGNLQLVGTACVSVLHGTIRLAGLLLSPNNAPISVEASLQKPILVFAQPQKACAEYEGDRSALSCTRSKFHAEIHQLVAKSSVIKEGEENSCLILISDISHQNCLKNTTGVLPLSINRAPDGADFGKRVVPGLRVKDVDKDELFQCENSSCKSASHIVLSQISPCNGKSRILVISTWMNKLRTCNVLHNQLLAKAGQVLLIDANIRFPVFNPPGVIGLYVCRGYRAFGEGHSWRYDGFGKPVQARFFGFESTDRDYSHYVRLLNSIITEARKLSWMSDLPILLCAEARTADSAIFANVIRQYDPNIVVDATNENSLGRSSVTSGAYHLFSDYHPDLNAGKQDDLRTLVTAESKLVQYLFPGIWEGRVLQIPSMSAPIWSIDDQESHALEVGMLLAFFDEDLELRSERVSHRWKAFGLVRGVDFNMMRAQILAPCSQKELARWQFYIIPNICLSRVLACTNNDHVHASWKGDFPFYMGDSIPNAAGMKSRKNLTRFMADL